MTSVRQSATLYREGAELDDLLADLDDQHPGQVRVVDVTYGREGGVLGFFAKRRVGVRYALDAASDGDVAVAAHFTEAAEVIDEVTDEMFDDRPATSPLGDLLAAAEAAEAEAMVMHGVAPARGVDGPDDGQPNVEFARMLLDLALTKANERRAAEQAAQAAFVEPGTRVTVPDLTPAPVVEPVTFSPVTVGKHAAAVAAAEPVVPAAAAFTATFGATAATAVPTPPPAPPTASAAAPRPPAPPLAAPPPARPVAVAPAAPVAPARPIRTPEIWTAPPRRIAPNSEPRRPRRHAATDAPAAYTDAELGIGALLRSARKRPVGAHRAGPDNGARTEFTLRRQLAELGVPVSWIPAAASEAYWAIEQLCAHVPAAPALDLAPGAVVVIAGPAQAAMRIATEICAQHRLDPSALVAAGCTTLDVPARRDVTQRWRAREVAASARAAAREPLIVVIDTEHAESDQWAAGIIAELDPDTVWAVVDATRKPADLGRQLVGLGRDTDALAVVKADRTASPASVWELGVPVASIDGRPATRGAWAALLINALAALED